MRIHNFTAQMKAMEFIRMINLQEVRVYFYFLKNSMMQFQKESKILLEARK